MYTIVTAFFDINRDNWNKYSRSVDKYFNNAKRIFTLKDNFIVFTQPEFIDRITKLCPTNTVIIPLNITDLYWYKHYNVISSIMNSPKFKNWLVNPNCPEVTQPLYDIIMYNKTKFVKQAIESNPFNSSHFVWLDFGIHDNMFTDDMLNTKLLPNGVDDKIHFLCRNYPSQSDLDINTFFKSNTNKFAGTMFSGSREYMLKFDQLLEADILDAFAQGVVDCDQSFFSNVYLKNPDIFVLHFGDWPELIKNYYGLTQNRFQVEYMYWSCDSELGKSLIGKFLNPSRVCDNKFLNPSGETNIESSQSEDIYLCSQIQKIPNTIATTIFFNNTQLNSDYVNKNLKLNLEILSGKKNIIIVDQCVDTYNKNLLVALGFRYSVSKDNFTLFSRDQVKNATNLCIGIHKSTESNVNKSENENKIINLNDTNSKINPSDLSESNKFSINFIDLNKTLGKQICKKQRWKLMCNWMSSEELCKLWNKMNPSDSGIEFTSSNEYDYCIIINKPLNSEYTNIDNSKTIVYRMEPDTETQPHWNDWYTHKSSFLFFGDLSKHMNNNEWHLSLDYDTLINTDINTYSKTGCLSAIISGLCISNGHNFRINLARNLQKFIPSHLFHIYGKNSSHLFSPHSGELPPHKKDDGLLPYKYHIAIENTDLPNYFTEKIIDGILTECLCFYWGCPNISTYINPQAYIQLPYYPDNLEKSIVDSINLIIHSINSNEWENRINIIRTEKMKILTEYSFVNRTKKIITNKK